MKEEERDKLLTLFSVNYGDKSFALGTPIYLSLKGTQEFKAVVFGIGVASDYKLRINWLVYSGTADTKILETVKDRLIEDIIKKVVEGEDLGLVECKSDFSDIVYSEKLGQLEKELTTETPKETA